MLNFAFILYLAAVNIAAYFFDVSRQTKSNKTAMAHSGKNLVFIVVVRRFYRRTFGNETFSS